MTHLTAGIFGDKEFIKKLGKQGTINDIMIYNHASSEGVFTFVSPNSEKIHPLLQTVSMIDFPVIVCEEVTKELAEQIVALDAFGFDRGFIVSGSEDLRKVISGTKLENYQWLADEKELRETIREIKSAELTHGTWAPVDNYFNVKGVGTVALSVMKGGKVKKYDKLFLQPLGKEVIVKGIQSQDKDIEEAQHGMRLGISLKGVEADELKRGYVLCKESSVSKKVKIRFEKSKFSKENLEQGSNVLLSVGLQVIAGKVDEVGNEILVSTEQEAVYFPNQRCIIASTQQAMPRIIGAGNIL